MGAGHFRFDDAETVIIDMEELVEPEYGFDLDCARDTIIDDIEIAVADTNFFGPLEMSWRSGRDGGRVIVQNGLYDIWVNEDDHGRLHVSYGLAGHIDDRMTALARHHLPQRAKAFFNRLACHYVLKVATSPWTSAPREGSRVAA